MKTKCIAALLFYTFIAFGAMAGPNEDMLVACKKGDLEGVKKAVSAGAAVNGIDEAGNAPISYAFFWPEVVKFLLENKADPNLGNITVLYQASYYCSADVVKLVLDAGADPNKVCKSNAASGFVKLIEEEKKKGKKANKFNIKVWEDAIKLIPTDIYTLPTLVATNNCISCLQMLLDKGAKIEGGATNGSLLHVFAASGASSEYRKTVYAAVKTSIEPYGFVVPEWFVNPPADRNAPPADILKLLLAKGLDINAKDKGAAGLPPRTPLEITLAGGFGNKEEVLLALIAQGANVKIETASSGPAIFQASNIGFASVVKAMVEKGADINTEGVFFGQTEGALLKGYTPLTIAALKGHLELAKYLISAGAKTDIGVEGKFFGAKSHCLTKVSNKTAIYYAIENGNVDMVKFMLESDVKWWKKIRIHEFKERGVGFNSVGDQVYKTSCFGAGEYTPSLYVSAVASSTAIVAANSVDQVGLTQEQVDGLQELKKQMKAKGI